MNLKDDEKELRSDDLIGHLTENKKVLPFPNRLRSNQASQKNQVLKKRVYAFCVDLYIIVGIKLMITFAYTSFFKSFFFQLPFKKQQHLLESLMMVDVAVTPLIFFTYFLISYYSGEGKSLGKLFFKLTVAQNQLTKDYLPTFKQALFRTLGYMACYLSLGTLFLMPFFRKDRRGLPDLLSGTQVYSDQVIYLEFAEKGPMADAPAEVIPLVDDNQAA